MSRIGHRFGRIEPRHTACAYIRDLLVDIDRRNCWNLTEPCQGWSRLRELQMAQVPPAAFAWRDP